MKKHALSLVELLVAMVLVFALSVIAINAFNMILRQDSDIYKIRHVVGTVSEITSRLSEDSEMYPSKQGFAYTKEGCYNKGDDDKKCYKGADKFRKLFKSKFNVLEDNIKFSKNGIGKVPAYSYTVPIATGKELEKIEFADFDDIKKIVCFTENKGITYCVPNTVELPENVFDFNPKNPPKKLKSIFVRVYLSAINPKKEDTFTTPKATYFEITYDGKIILPRDIIIGPKYERLIARYIDQNGHPERKFYDNLEREVNKSVTSTFLDCFIPAFRDCYQCKAIESMKDSTIITTDSSKHND